MRDKRPVDELSIEDLERLLVIRKRQERQDRLRRMAARGRVVPAPPPVDEALVPDVAPAATAVAESDPADGTEPQRHEAAQALQPPEPPVSYDITDDVPRFEDEIDPPPRPRRTHATPHAVPAKRGAPRRRERWDKLLLVVEVTALIGIVLVLGLGAYLVFDENDRIEALEEKSAEIQRDAAALRPTATPQAELRVQLSDYVLPGGHIYNDGIGQFNLDELPSSIRPLAAEQINLAPQTIVEDRPLTSPVTVEIPAIGVNASIYAGDDWYQLQKGVGHFLGSANPGEQANMVLTAHNDIYGSIFRYIEDLQPGDQVRVEAKDGRWYTYVVESKRVVEPNQVEVLERGNEAMVTLITCYPYQVDTHRMVVFARLVE